MIKDLLILLVIGAAAWFGYTHLEAPVRRLLGLAPPPATVRVLPPQFACDGRVFCSQMTSCEEARFFLRNCPANRMTDEGDGSACEKRWCK